MDFINQTFTDQTINLDDNAFRNCTFERCLLVFSGTGKATLIGNTVKDSDFGFKDAAGMTLVFLTALYRHGAASVVEGVFDNIRKGNYSQENGVIRSGGVH